MISVSFIPAGSNIGNTTTTPEAITPRRPARPRCVWTKISTWTLARRGLISASRLPHWPRLVLGYEYDYQKGRGIRAPVGARVPHWDSRTLRQSARASMKARTFSNLISTTKFMACQSRTSFAASFTVSIRIKSAVDSRTTTTENVGEGTSYFQGANTLRLEKKFSDWFFGSGGYLYSKLNSDASFVDAFSLGTVAAAPEISLERESHIFNLNGLFGPFNGLTLSTGVESEWTREQGFGSGCFEPDQPASAAGNAANSRRRHCPPITTRMPPRKTWRCITPKFPSPRCLRRRGCDRNASAKRSLTSNPGMARRAATTCRIPRPPAS